jgi:hypothetical protein
MAITAADATDTRLLFGSGLITALGREDGNRLALSAAAQLRKRHRWVSVGPFALPTKIHKGRLLPANCTLAIELSSVSVILRSP